MSAQHLSPILPLARVRELIPLSRSQIFRLEKSGHFPRRIRIGQRRVGWLTSDIEDWLQERKKTPSTKQLEG